MALRLLATNFSVLVALVGLCSAAQAQPTPEDLRATARAQIVQSATNLAGVAQLTAAQARDSYGKCDIDGGDQLRTKIADQRKDLAQLEAIAARPDSFTAPVVGDIATQLTRFDEAAKQAEYAWRDALINCFGREGVSMTGYRLLNGIGEVFIRLELLENVLPVFDEPTVIDTPLPPNKAEVCYAIDRYKSLYEQLRNMIESMPGKEITEAPLKWGSFDDVLKTSNRNEFENLPTPEDLRRKYRCPR